MFETIIYGMILITIFVVICAATQNIPNNEVSFKESKIEEDNYNKEKELADFRKIVLRLWLNGLTYEDGYNPFQTFSFNEWRERLFYIDFLITDLNHRYCKQYIDVERCPVNYPDKLKINCNLDILYLYDKYLRDKDFLSLNIETVTQLEWIEFEYINYLFNCYVYHKIPMDEINDKHMHYYVAHLKRGSMIYRRYDCNHYFSKYPSSLFIKNMLKYPLIKKLKMKSNDLKKFYEEGDARIIQYPVNSVRCFSCFKNYYEWKMKRIEITVLDTIRDKYELLKEKIRTERLQKMKELNKKKPKRNKLNHYNKKRGNIK